MASQTKNCDNKTFDKLYYELCNKELKFPNKIPSNNVFLTDVLKISNIDIMSDLMKFITIIKCINSSNTYYIDLALKNISIKNEKKHKEMIHNCFKYILYGYYEVNISDKAFITYKKLRYFNCPNTIFRQLDQILEIFYKYYPDVVKEEYELTSLYNNKNILFDITSHTLTKIKRLLSK